MLTAVTPVQRLANSRLLRRVAAAMPGTLLFLTGGSLRDRLLGLATHDLDLVVDGDPREAAAAIARSVNVRCFPLGRPPRVAWRMVTGQVQIDVVALQGRSVEADVRRRDFTVNALLWRLPRGPLFDLVGGLDDLAAGRIRVVRRSNLDDDPLRVLRGLRLAATRPSLRLTAESERALSAAAPGLVRVARERVIGELELMLAGVGVTRALLAAARLRVLAELIPGWHRLAEPQRLASLAGRLVELRSGRSALAQGAAAVAPAVLAAPAAGFPGSWDRGAAVTALATIWPARAARSAVRAAELGERFALGMAGTDARALAVGAENDLAGAVAWAAARSDTPEAAPAARRLLRWWRSFAVRPPLLPGDEVAAQLGLPHGPARAEAVRRLREAQARGEIRTADQARRWLGV
jgi:tRNA nucleotidyltransferase/poly(A) polymerase